MKIFICTITCFLLSLSLSAQYRYSSRKEIKPTRSGYFNISEFGYAPAYDSFYNPGALTISTINGYKPSDHFLRVWAFLICDSTMAINTSLTSYPSLPIFGLTLVAERL